MQNNRLLKVGFISPGWPLSSFPNGIVSYTENLIAGLPDDVSPTVIANQTGEVELDSYVIDLADYKSKHSEITSKIFTKITSMLAYDKTEHIKYKQNLRSYSYAILEALNYLNDGIDILEAEESFGLTYYAANKLKVPLVTRLHGPWFTMKDIFMLPDNEQYKLRVFYEGQTISNSDGITSPSLDVLEKVREYYNLELPNAEVIPNPVPVVNDNQQWEQTQTEDKPYVLFVGRFDAHKGGDLIIKAFNIIAQSDKSVDLYFVGPDRGIVENDKKFNIEEYIDEVITNPGIRERIKFFDHCGSEQIKKLRRHARVTVCCSRYENFPVSLLEALATGCPVVASRVGGIKEIIVDDFNGLFAEPKNPSSIADKVLTLLNDGNKSIQLSTNAINDAAKRFSPKVVANQSVDYYKRIINSYS